MKELLIGFSGVILGFILTIIWDWYKTHEKFLDMLKIVLYELEGVAEGVRQSVNRLPKGLKKKALKQDRFQLSDAEIEDLPMSIPKPVQLMRGKPSLQLGI